MRQPNIFEALGFSPREAAKLSAKADLLSEIVKLAKRRKPAQLRRLFGATQAQVDNLLKGKLSKVSLKTLNRYASLLNLP